MSPSGRTIIVYQEDDGFSILDLLLTTEIEMSPATRSSTLGDHLAGMSWFRESASSVGVPSMKIVELGQSDPSLDELMGQAKENPLVLRKPDGSVFILSQVDDFDVEVELLKNRSGFMAFLRGLSQEEATISLPGFAARTGLVR